MARWLIDTGCGKDLLSKRHVAPFRNRIITVDGMKFGIANGLTETDEALPIIIGAFGENNEY